MPIGDMSNWDIGVPVAKLLTTTTTTKNAHIRRSIKPTDSWSEPLHMNALFILRQSLMYVHRGRPYRKKQDPNLPKGSFSTRFTKKKRVCYNMRH